MSRLPCRSRKGATSARSIDRARATSSPFPTIAPRGEALSFPAIAPIAEAHPHPAPMPRGEALPRAALPARPPPPAHPAIGGSHAALHLLLLPPSPARTAQGRPEQRDLEPTWLVGAHASHPPAGSFPGARRKRDLPTRRSSPRQTPRYRAGRPAEGRGAGRGRHGGPPPAALKIPRQPVAPAPPPAVRGGRRERWLRRGRAVRWRRRAGRRRARGGRACGWRGPRTTAPTVSRWR